MLRVLPTRYTSALPDLRRLLLDLGLVPAEEGEGWAVLDSRSGRVRLRSAEKGSARDGTTVFGVEIRDPAEFARRTAQDGGQAALEETPAGARVRITGPDGFEFLAEPTAHAGRYTDADPDLTVRLEWHTPDLERAAAALAAIGGRPRPQGLLGPRESREFTAKNGGVLAAVRDAATSVSLAFEYAGPAKELQPRLALAGWRMDTEAERTRDAESAARSLPETETGREEQEASLSPGRSGGVVRVTVPLPDGSTITILTTGGPERARMR